MPDQGVLIADSVQPEFMSVINPVTSLDDNSNIDMTVLTSQPPAWINGLEPVERPGYSANEQGIAVFIIVLLLALCLCFKSVCRVWAELTHRLFASNPLQTVEHATSAEKRTIGLLLATAVVFITIPLMGALSTFSNGLYAFTFENIVMTALAVGAYFVFQYAVYNVVGLTFTTSEGCALWTRSFTASMSILGIVLILPALTIIFYPVITLPMVFVAAIFYIIARILFIYKGFRIFYTNFGSLVYFILYLCTLEIVPIFILFHIVLSFV